MLQHNDKQKLHIFIILGDRFQVFYLLGLSLPLLRLLMVGYNELTLTLTY